jgi:hypothetical protein
MPTLELRGTNLRYVLTYFLAQHGPKTIPELIDGLEYQGFSIPGRASKTISDALRCEQVHGRVVRMRRGRYKFWDMPRSTEYRIHNRVMELRRTAKGRLHSRDRLNH